MEKGLKIEMYFEMVTHLYLSICPKILFKIYSYVICTLFIGKFIHPPGGEGGFVVDRASCENHVIRVHEILYIKVGNNILILQSNF